MSFSCIYKSPLGTIKIFCDGKSLTKLDFVSTEEEEEYSCIEDSFVDSILRETKEWLDCYFNGENKKFILPIRISATDFQTSILLSLMKIPYGTTITYGEIAKAVGCRSAQAIGRALSLNPLPIILPCHRVVGAKGVLGGYAYGTERKTWLLEHEGIILPLY